MIPIDFVVELLVDAAYIVMCARQRINYYLSSYIPEPQVADDRLSHDVRRGAVHKKRAINRSASFT